MTTSIKFPILVFSTLILFFTACSKRPTDVSSEVCSSDFGWTDSSMKHPKNAIYTKMINELTDGGLPGIALMIEDKDGIWYKSAGYADIGNAIKMEPCHLIKIASATKLFTAALVYQLVADGKLSLDDLASKYIDKKHVDRIENLEKVRVRDLLAHSSGIYDVVFDASFILNTFNNLDKEKSYEKILSFAYGKKAAFEYNTKQEYNQTLNHVLLAMIVNKLTGEDQAMMLRKEIFQPLQMMNSYIRPQENIPWEQVAKGYYDYRRTGVLQDLTPLYTGDGTGFTGIYSNVNDLRIFTNALFKNKTLLPQSMFDEMTNIKSADPELKCAGGCRIKKMTVNGQQIVWYGHPGGEVNYGSGAFYCPQIDATITIAINYGVAFVDMGAYTDAYFSFRDQLFEEVSK